MQRGGGKSMRRRNRTTGGATGAIMNADLHRRFSVQRAHPFFNATVCPQGPTSMLNNQCTGKPVSARNASGIDQALRRTTSPPDTRSRQRSSADAVRHLRWLAGHKLLYIDGCTLPKLSEEKAGLRTSSSPWRVVVFHKLHAVEGPRR